MEQKIQKKLFVFQIIAMNWERQILTIPKKVLVIEYQCVNKTLQFHKSLREIFSQSAFLRVIKKYDKRALMKISQVFGTL